MDEKAERPPLAGSGEEEEDLLYASVFPASGKLDAYGMALSDIAVFEAAGHARDDIGQLATYGFVTFRGVRMLLESAVGGLRSGEPTVALEEALQGARFLDLGSGDGRAVIGAAILAPALGEAAGVELSLSRHELALKNRARLPEALQTVVRFEQADLLALDVACLAAADVIWVANLRFPDEAVAAVNARLERNCAGRSRAVVATLRECRFSRPHAAWTAEVPMSWNPAGWPVFFYRLEPLQTGAA